MRTLLAIALAPLLAAGCGDDDGGQVDAPMTADARPDATPPPPMPSVGATQLDRMGRPAINTALNVPFESDMGVKEAAKDAYNAATTAAEWMTYVPAFAASLAAFDGLDTLVEDGDGCGNQAFFDPPPDAGGGTGYVTLAAVAADDRLYVDTSKTGPCFVYLGVEANATGFLPNDDCGGRVPKVTVTETQDPIDVTYSLVATGEAGTVSDGVNADDHQSAVTNDTFPFLAPP
jgi:hypothetical protein